MQLNFLASVCHFEGYVTKRQIPLKFAVSRLHGWVISVHIYMEAVVGDRPRIYMVVA